MDTAVTFSEKNCYKKVRICFFKFLKKKCHRKLCICVFKKGIEKICLQDAFHLENNEIVTFRISCVDQIFKMSMSWCLLGCFASSFAILNTSQVICTFHIFDRNQKFYRCSAIKTFKSEGYKCCRSGRTS